MTVASGCEVQLVAGEPLVRQPVAIEFDDRGRLWVIQYLQYPNPTGLNRVRWDRYSRTVYDKVPKPPPRGPQGADRLTILEDTDGDGDADASKDFVAGLNLASGFVFGHGGVYVLQSPYLLFYADRDGDDVPDGDPQVLLSGFGIEDAHSVANSLTWGPDGWLYGNQGSTVTANIRGIEFQQGVWRYHPESGEFELFCEGGGNMWGLDFDLHGNLFASTNLGPYLMIHAVQGGYYWKNFGKHGALHNPYTFGYFDHVPHDDFRGGHVTVGGIVYEADGLPSEFRGKYIAANLLSHDVYWHTITPRGSTFRSRHAGELLLSNDTWFAPSDVTTGPDGAIYVADWHDVRTAHPDPDADWDRRNGRIYRIAAKGTKPAGDPRLTGATSAELVAALTDRNNWRARAARSILVSRHDVTVYPRLTEMALQQSHERLALEALWALASCGQFDEALGERLLSHASADVRRWCVRLLADRKSVSPRLAARLMELVTTEHDMTVRSQLAASAKRIPAEVALPLIERLLQRASDSGDAHIPLLLWWALETHATSDVDGVLARFASRAAWQNAWLRSEILPRLARRYMAESNNEGYLACARLLDAAPTRDDRRMLLAAMNEATVGRRAMSAPAALEAAVAEESKHAIRDAVALTFAVRLGSTEAFEQALTIACDPTAAKELRITAIALIGETGRNDAVASMLTLLGECRDESVRTVVISALGGLDDERIAQALCEQYSRFAGPLRQVARDVLLRRPAWAIEFLRRVDAGEINAADVPLDAIRPLAHFGNPQIDELVRMHWGTLQAASAGEKLAEVRRLNNDLRAGAGDALRGLLVFKEHCAACHRFFGQGTPLGPDLSTANRHDTDFLLTSIVDPSAIVRKEFMSYLVQTTDGRLLTGLLSDEGASGVVIIDAKNHPTRVLAADVERIEPAALSLMPEGIHQKLSPAQLRDLFCYLQQANGTLAEPGALAPGAAAAQEAESTKAP